MSSRFTDFDAYKQAMTGWGLDFIQLDRGPLSANFAVLQGRRSLVINLTLNRTFRQRGLAPDLGRTFGILADPATQVKLLGRDMETDVLVVFPADGAFEAYSTPDFDVYAISVSDAALVQAAQVYGLQDALDGLTPDPVHVRCPASDIARLRQFLRAALPSALDGVASHGDRDLEIARLVLTALAGRIEDRRPPPSRMRDRAYKAATEYILECCDQDLSIADVCRHAGASERTLRYAFEEKIGVSPKAFLTAVRFNRLRSALLAAAPREAYVKDVATKYGLTEFGRLAVDYRRMFGERPSDTLKRSL